MSDVQFFWTMLAVALFLPLAAWPLMEAPRGRRLLSSLPVLTLLAFLSLAFWGGSGNQPGTAEQCALLSDKAFAALVAFWLLVLPFATWPLSEPRCGKPG